MNMQIKATCSICKGKGVVPCRLCNGIDKGGAEKPCERCGGEFEEQCPGCSGKGHNN